MEIWVAVSGPEARSRPSSRPPRGWSAACAGRSIALAQRGQRASSSCEISATTSGSPVSNSSTSRARATGIAA
eukprot:4314310-Pyramimonas_sp.AAC.1